MVYTPVNQVPVVKPLLTYAQNVSLKESLTVWGWEYLEVPHAYIPGVPVVE